MQTNRKSSTIAKGKMTETITRKQIACAAGVSEKTVSRREHNWGISRCRSAASKRPQLYFREQVNRALVPRHIIPRPI